MESFRRLFPAKFGLLDDETAAFIRTKTGAERLAMAGEITAGIRRMLSNHLRTEHPDWSELHVNYEVARRLSHEAAEILKVARHIDTDFIVRWSRRLDLDEAEGMDR
jgi:hypothetical protein